jgi:hypothetical protein
MEQTMASLACRCWEKMDHQEMQRDRLGQMKSALGLSLWDRPEVKTQEQG